MPALNPAVRHMGSVRAAPFLAGYPLARLSFLLTIICCPAVALKKTSNASVGAPGRADHG